MPIPYLCFKYKMIQNNPAEACLLQLLNGRNTEMRILIVDDNHTNIIIVREILKKENYHKTAVASSAKEMFEVLGLSETPKSRESLVGEIDLILLDMMMPEMDGIEACRVLQQHEHLKEIPVIMVTAVGDSKKLAEALDAG